MKFVRIGATTCRKKDINRQDGSGFTMVLLVMTNQVPIYYNKDRNFDQQQYQQQLVIFYGQEFFS